MSCAGAGRRRSPRTRPGDCWRAVMRRHFVALAAFLVKAHPPALATRVIVLDPHGNDGADASEKMAMSSGFGAFTHRVRQAPQLRGGTTHLTMGAPKARNRDDADRLPVVVASADRILHTPKHRCEPRSRGRAGQFPHPVAVTPWRKAANSFPGPGCGIRQPGAHVSAQDRR